ncbi:MAG: peptidase U32 family protein [Patescibacteria group bacterium]
MVVKPELLAPIQDFISLQAAIQGGCDAVYFGVRGFNMRAGAKNFTVADLKKIAGICHKNKIRAYLAVNTIIYQDELKNIESILKKARAAGVDAIICWDMAVLQTAKKLGHKIHLSTQASISNSAAAEFYKAAGVERIILARECLLGDIKKINMALNPMGKKIAIGLEIFIHGAMCVSVSGRCFLSGFNYGKSANRGECLQSCRRRYLIKEIEEGKEFEIGEDYVLSPKDLCALPFIEKLFQSGAVSFKIEGRNRSPEYVRTVTGVYRRAIDEYFENNKKKDFKKRFEALKTELLRELKTVYNRDFSDGFYLGKPVNQWTHSYGSRATEKKIHLGKVVHFYNKISVAEIAIQAGKNLKAGDEIYIQGPATGVFRQKVNSMESEHRQIKKAGQGDIVAIKTNKLVRANDLAYKIVKN